MAFNNRISLIVPGEPVAAGVANRPTRKLDENVRYLKDLVDASALGQAVFARDATVETATVVGSPVYYNAQHSCFELALSATATDSVNQRLITADSSKVWGIVYSKTNATLADIMLLGYGSVDISNVLEGTETLTAGPYYLSTTTAGKLTSTKPSIAILVLQADGAGKVFISPKWDDVLENHTHLHFKLKALPAGTHTAGSPHEITTPDVDIEGWLPADHSSFNGNAPADAVFGYNINANTGLKKAWPPVPPESAVLFMDGIMLESGVRGLVQFDRNGIWWMSAQDDEVPFPNAIETTPTELSNWSEPSDYPADYEYRMQLDLYFTNYTFLTDQTVVTKLVTRDNRILITCEGDTNTPAGVGALELALSLDFSSDDTTNLTGQAFKAYNETTSTFELGPVVSGFYALSTAVTLTGEASRVQTISSVDRTVVSGAVGIDVDTGIGRELPVQLIRVDGAREEYTEDVMYLSLPNGKDTSFRARLHVPETLDLTSPTMKIKLRLLALGNATINDTMLTLTSRRITQPVAVNTAVALPTSDTARTLSFSVTPAVEEYFDIESDEFTVAAGDDVLFTLSRTSGDAYGYAIGVIRLAGILVP